MTTIEQVRQRLGLSRPQMLYAIGAKPGRTAILTAQDDTRVDRVFTDAALALEHRYDRWKRSILRQIELEEAVDLPDFAEMLDCSRFLLYQMLRRNSFHAPRKPGSRQLMITPDVVHAFFAFNETVLTRPTVIYDGVLGRERRLVRGPLADLFLKAAGVRYGQRGPARLPIPLRRSA